MIESTAIRAFKDAIQILAGTYNKDLVSILLCNVNDNSKAESNFTIDCTPISGESTTPIPNVKLNAEKNDGFLIIPPNNSTVLVMTSNRNDYFVFMYSDIEKVVCIIDNNNSFTFDSNGFIWNEGINGGLVKVNALLAKINTLEAKINQIATWALTVTPPVTIAPITPTTLTEIEDTKIKH